MNMAPVLDAKKINTDLGIFYSMKMRIMRVIDRVSRSRRSLGSQHDTIATTFSKDALREAGRTE